MAEPANLNLPLGTPAPQKVPPKTLEQVLHEHLPEVLGSISAQDRPKLAHVMMREQVIRTGPLPVPSELAAYNSIIPDGADRIMKMAEVQSNHRIEIENIVVKSQQNQALRGQIFGLIIGLTGLSLATYAAVVGQPWFGGTIGSATLVSLVSAFLVAKQKEKQELTQKRPEVTRPTQTNRKGR
jgi:uncharacterized membrane protein